MALLGLSASSSVSGLGHEALLAHTLKKGTELPKVDDARVADIAQYMGLPRGFLNVEMPEDVDVPASYWGPGAINQQDKELIESIRTAGTPEERKVFDERGMVVYPASQASPHVVAHEMGHAADQGRPWRHPGKLAYELDMLLPRKKYLGYGGMLGGALSGWKTKSPMKGALGGLTTAALLMAPNLVSEARATRQTNQYMDQSDYSDEIKDKSRSLSRLAFATHLAPLVMPTAVGMATGWLGNQWGGDE
jgi:hypothetical protein